MGLGISTERVNAKASGLKIDSKTESIISNECDGVIKKITNNSYDKIETIKITQNILL